MTMPNWLAKLRSPKWLVLPPLGIGLAVVVLMSWMRRDLPRVELGEVATPVEIIEVRRQSFQPSITGYGTAAPRRTWSAVTEVAGRITATHPRLDTGESVSEDAVLVRIDDTDYRLRVEQRQADFEAAQAQLRELQASKAADQRSLEIESDLLEVSRQDVQRMRELRDSRAVTSRDLERAQASLLQQRQSVQRLENSLSLYPAKIASATASIALAQSRLDEAERDIERTEIRSPFAGTLLDVELEVGQFVPRGERLFQLQDRSVIEVEAQYSLSQFDQLIPDTADKYQADTYQAMNTPPVRELLDSMSAEVLVRSGDASYRWQGLPVRLTESLDPQTRTMGVIIQVTNGVPRIGNSNANGPLWGPGTGQQVAGAPPQTPVQKPLRSLPPGAFCEVRLRREIDDEAIVIPRSAVESGSVFVVDLEDRMRSHPVELGMSMEDFVIVSTGLQPEDRVVVNPPTPAIDGQRVEPIAVRRSKLESNSVDSRDASLHRGGKKGEATMHTEVEAESDSR